jgi:hypothetical protein
MPKYTNSEYLPFHGEVEEQAENVMEEQNGDVEEQVGVEEQAGDVKNTGNIKHTRDVETETFSV